MPFLNQSDDDDDTFEIRMPCYGSGTTGGSVSSGSTRSLATSATSSIISSGGSSVGSSFRNTGSFRGSFVGNGGGGGAGSNNNNNNNMVDWDIVALDLEQSVLPSAYAETIGEENDDGGVNKAKKKKKKSKKKSNGKGKSKSKKVWNIDDEIMKKSGEEENNETFRRWCVSLKLQCLIFLGATLILIGLFESYRPKRHFIDTHSGTQIIAPPPLDPKFEEICTSLIPSSSSPPPPSSVSLETTMSVCLETCLKAKCCRIFDVGIDPDSCFYGDYVQQCRVYDVVCSDLDLYLNRVKGESEEEEKKEEEEEGKEEEEDKEQIGGGIDQLKQEHDVLDSIKEDGESDIQQEEGKDVETPEDSNTNSTLQNDAIVGTSEVEEEMKTAEYAVAACTTNITSSSSNNNTFVDTKCRQLCEPYECCFLSENDDANCVKEKLEQCIEYAVCEKVYENHSR